MKKLFIIMPAFNEGAVIASTIKQAYKTRIAGFEKPEVIVVDDGSSDNTAEEAIASGAIVFSHLINLGAGGATRTGLKYALRESNEDSVIVTMDSDGQHASEDVTKLVQGLVDKKVDIVVGTRLRKGKNSMPWYRKIGNNGLTRLSKILFGIKIKDTQSGMRAYTKNALKSVVEYQSDRYGFCTETLWLAQKASLKVIEIPISIIYSDYSLSKGQSNWNAFNLILELIWIKVSR